MARADTAGNRAGPGTPAGMDSFTRELVDPVGGLGPLRGVLTALENAGTEHVVVTPVDMPGLIAGQLRWLASMFFMECSHGRHSLRSDDPPRSG